MGTKILTEIISRCPECGGPGQVLCRREETLTLECFEHKHRWISLSEICPGCGEPNGYVVPGLCVRCYSETR